MTVRADVQVHLGTFRLRCQLELEDGEVVAVVGPNGSGKTTLLRSLCGLQQLTTGHVEIDGQVLDDPLAGTFVQPENRSCGLVHQEHLLFPHLSALDNVAFGPRSRGVSREESTRRSLLWLRRMGLEDHADMKPAHLSGGQAQRVGLARSLAVEPRLLLLDEPLSSLDVATRGEIRDELRRHLQSFSGCCVIATHDLLDAAALSDTVLVLEEGSCTQEGAFNELVSFPRTPYVAKLVGKNLLRGTADGATIALESGTRMPLSQSAHGECLVAVSPRHVCVDTSAQTGIDLPGWPASVHEILPFGEQVRLVLAGPVRLTAEITPAELAAHGLSEGDVVRVWLDANSVSTYSSDEGRTKVEM